MSLYDWRLYYKARFQTRQLMSRYRCVLSPVMDYRPMTAADIMRRLGWTETELRSAWGDR